MQENTRFGRRSCIYVECTHLRTRNPAWNEACYGRGAPLFFWDYSHEELFTSPKKCFWRKMKVLHDEQSHGLVHNEKYCIATMNSDDFGLKSPVIQDVFEPNMYTYII